MLRPPLRTRTVHYLLSAVLALAAPAAVHAQQTDSARPYQQVISVNPFGIVIGLANAEYERIVSDYSTFGVGGSYNSSKREYDSSRGEYDSPTDRYLNADVFWRFYPGGSPLKGFTAGAKAGITHVDGHTYPGLGFDANYSWLMGPRNFYVGIGFGLKRLYGVDNDIFLKTIPTIRIVNIGIPF